MSLEMLYIQAPYTCKRFCHVRVYMGHFREEKSTQSFDICSYLVRRGEGSPTLAGISGDPYMKSEKHWFIVARSLSPKRDGNGYLAKNTPGHALINASGRKDNMLFIYCCDVSPYDRCVLKSGFLKIFSDTHETLSTQYDIYACDSSRGVEVVTRLLWQERLRLLPRQHFKRNDARCLR